MTTKALDLALWLPDAPNVGDVVQVSTLVPLATSFVPLPAGGGGPGNLPKSMNEGDILVSGPGPTFDWFAGRLDGGRF